MFAQNEDAQQKQIVVKPADSDRDAARQAKVVFRRASPKHAQTPIEKSNLVYRASTRHDESRGGESRDNPIRFPGDLTYQGGAVVEFAESHNIYMLPGSTCASAACWGNPEQFLRDLGKSEFIHVTDQYVGQHASNRYTLGQSASVSFTQSTTPLTDDQMQAVVHAVALKTGETGYRHIYHVFLPPGQDECFDSTFSVCASNVFCAYHSSTDFKDIGHVLYSVEPFADVPGCQVRPGTPNGTETDSQNSALSHELIETITDPDGDAWWNAVNLADFGQEIADECVFLLFTPTAVFSDPAIITVRGHRYALQAEYNNHVHGCTAEQ
jgi:hypothetical protein